ncbi:hypothetical protein AGMMS49546_01920 [Spirochaetia bacterium]|nr:hypothetical protein AGMMS49546_01920 [Spirochaetia bacterium]
MKEGKHTIERDKCTFCGACVNACYVEALKIYGRNITAEEAAEIVMKDKSFYDSSGGGLTVSGGECLLQPEFVLELFSILKAHGIHTAVDTCGDIPQDNIDSILNVTDLFLYDLKHTDPVQHKAGTGRDNKQILENLRYLSDHGKAVEIRIPLIPGYNDTEENLCCAGEILKDIKTLTKAVILPYHDYARTKFTALGMEDTMPVVSLPTNEDLNRAVAILRSYNVNAQSVRD